MGGLPLTLLKAFNFSASPEQPQLSERRRNLLQ